MPFDEANKLSSFILPMMKLHPDKRAAARDLLDHTWLEGILVEGELELMRRQGLYGPDADVPMSGDAPPTGFSAEEDQDALDALKPISTSLASSLSSPTQGGVHLNPQALQEAQRRAAEHHAAQQAAKALQGGASKAVSPPAQTDRAPGGGPATPDSRSAPPPATSTPGIAAATPRTASQPASKPRNADTSPQAIARPIATTGA